MLWGGLSKEDNNTEYTPATLAGYITQKVTGDDNKAAKADISSSVINTGADTIPIVGNAVGVVLSLADTFYDTGKFILSPSWSNLSDIGTSLAGVIPGIGSIKDAKNVYKATTEIARNVKTTRKLKSIPKTLTPRTNTTRVNILKPDMKVKRSYSLPLPSMPYTRVIGTIGNSTDTVEDTWQGITQLWSPKLTIK